MITIFISMYMHTLITVVGINCILPEEYPISGIKQQ